MFGLRRSNPDKEKKRFRRPEFQERLARARRFQRKTPPPEGTAFVSRFVQAAGILVILLIVYFFALSPVFLVRAVILNSAGPTEEQLAEVLKRLEKERFYLVSRNHILFLNRESLLKALQEDLPAVRQISSFQRVFPDKVVIALEERKPLYLWQSGDQHYLLDQDGVVFQKITRYDPTVFPEALISNRAAEAVALGEHLEIDKLLNFVRESQELWPREISQTNYISFSIPSLKSPDLIVKTATGFAVYFDIERSATSQIKNLKLLLSQEIGPDTYSGLSYIDLRLPTVGYYCYKDTLCAAPSSPSP